MKRNRIIYFLLCVAALILASFYGGPVSYSLLFGLLLVTPVSLIYLLAVYFFFRIYQVIGSKHITTYEPVPYYFVLQNEYLLNFCHISVGTYSTFSNIEELTVRKLRNDTPEKDKITGKKGNNKNKDKNNEKVRKISSAGTVYELLPGENVRFDTTLICKYRGDYYVGIKEITIVDFFRLFKITYHVPEPLGAIVSPRIIKLDALKCLSDPVFSTYKENPNLKTDFDASVREYVPGDPLKGIHWKSTAKAGKLLSRITYGEQRQGISIFIDTKRISDDEYEYIPVENKCMEIVLALTDYFSNYSIPVTCFYDQKAMKTLSCGNPGEMELFLKNFAQLHFMEDEDAGSALDTLLTGTAFKDCMLAFLVITDIDVDLNKRLYALSLLGINTVIYYVSSSPNLASIIELANQTVIPVNPEDDLTKVL